MRRALASTFLCLLSAACAAPAPKPDAPAAARLAMASVDPDAVRFEVPFKEKGAPDGRAIFAKTGASGRSATLQRGSGGSCRLGADWETLMSRVTSVGTVDVAGEGSDEVFVLDEDGGTGSHDEILLLLDPRGCAVTGLMVTVFHDATRKTTPEAGVGAYDDSARGPERRFLDSIKRRYGFVGKGDAEGQSANPEFAYYFWARDNGGLSNGRMKIRRFKGRPALKSSSQAEIKEGAATYTAQFKAGVVAYDSAADEHYVLFHPDDAYAWPTALARLGPYLLIGTRGEGVAAVDLRDFRLKKIRFHDANDSVATIEVKGSAATVNGGVPVPGL